MAENSTAEEEEDVYTGFREADIEAADRMMQEHTYPEETYTGQEPMQLVQPVQPVQTRQTEQ